MTEADLQRLIERSDAAPWRVRLGTWIESDGVRRTILAAILVNAVALGLYTDPTVLTSWDPVLRLVDLVCLAVFAVELAIKLLVYRAQFFRSGWNVFDLLVVGIALVPGNGALSVLRTLRVLRVLRVLTVVPSMRRVVAAFIHAIPGLASVVAVMAIFFYVAAVMAVGFFGETAPQWFGSMGKSLFTLFQVMTLESWSMGIVRPVMATHPAAWAFFVPFIVLATFTILNLFIGIIVSTMQELSVLPDPEARDAETLALLSRIEDDLTRLRRSLGDRS